MQAREDHKEGRIDDQELKAVEDEAIKDVVKMQEDVGLQSATDGEFRRASWHMDFIYQLDGVSTAPGHLKVEFRNEEGTIEFTPAALHIDGKLGVVDLAVLVVLARLHQLLGPQQAADVVGAVGRTRPLCHWVLLPSYPRQIV